MKILVYGAGVLGSLYAGRLSASGHDVTVLDLPRRLAEIREHGLVLQDALTGQRTVERVGLAEELRPEDSYDLVLVPVRTTQLSGVLRALATNRRTTTVLFMVNSAAGPGEIVETLGRERVLLGFPGAGGAVKGPMVEYRVLPGWVQATTLGELNGRTSDRLERVAGALREAGFPVATSTDMVSWQKTHVALVSPMANALYAVGGDNHRLARTRDGFVLMIRAWREGFRVLQALGTPITPPKLWMLGWMPEPLQVALWRRVLDTRMANIVVTRHANAAREEMKKLADMFMELVRASEVPTPAIDRLYPYADADAAPIPEGSAGIPPDWRGRGGAGLGVLAVGAAFALLWAGRRRHRNSRRALKEPRGKGEKW